MIKRNEFNFLTNKVTSESARKSYITLFKNIAEYESHKGIEISKWKKQDCVDFLSGLGSKKYNTIAVKWSLLKKYLCFINNNVYQEIAKSDLEVCVEIFFVRGSKMVGREHYFFQDLKEMEDKGNEDVGLLASNIYS